MVPWNQWRMPLLQQKMNKMMQQQQKIKWNVMQGAPSSLRSNTKIGHRKEYEPMTINEDNQDKPRFSLPHGLDLSARALLELYLSGSFLYDVVKHTNEYGHYRAPQTFKNVMIGEIYVFFSIILYMGVVQLPSKEDYWKVGTVWPSHTPCQ